MQYGAVLEPASSKFRRVYLQNNWDGGEVFSCGSELDASIDLLPKSNTVIGALSELEWHSCHGVEHDVASLNMCKNTMKIGAVDRILVKCCLDKKNIGLWHPVPVIGYQMPDTSATAHPDSIQLFQLFRLNPSPVFELK